MLTDPISSLFLGCFIVLISYLYLIHERNKYRRAHREMVKRLINLHNSYQPDKKLPTNAEAIDHFEDMILNRSRHFDGTSETKHIGWTEL